MPRRSSRPAGGRRPAARAPPRSAPRSPPPAPRRAASTSAAPTKSKTAPPPAPVQQQPQGSAMGGFMANVASTGLGVMAGRAMDRAFFGGGSAAAPPAEGAEAPAPDAAWDYNAQSQMEQVPDSVCAREAIEFKKCMERTGSNVGECQWNFELLATCQRQQQEEAAPRLY